MTAKLSSAAKPLTWVEGEPSPYELHDIVHFPDWKNILTLDAFFNNLASGFMIATGLLWFLHGGQFNDLFLFSFTAAFVIVCIDLLDLIADLGDHFRFIHTLRIFRHTSALSVGVVGLVFYTVMLFIGLVFWWILFASNVSNGFLGPATTAFEVIGNVFIILGFVGACLVIIYKGVVFSASSQPGVREGRWLTVWMVFDSLLMGLGLFAIFAFIFDREPFLHQIAIPVMVLIALRCIGHVLLSTNTGLREQKRYSMPMRMVDLFVVYIVGSFAPFILMFFPPGGPLVAGALVLFVGLWQRYYYIGLAKHL